MSENEVKANAFRFTLNTKKVIVLKEPKISDTEHATKLAGIQAGPENNALLSVLFQKEMVKLLLVEVDGKKLSMTDKAQLDGLFSLAEYNQVSKALKHIVGDSGGNEELIPEITTL